MSAITHVNYEKLTIKRKMVLRAATKSTKVVLKMIEQPPKAIMLADTIENMGIEVQTSK